MKKSLFVALFAFGIFFQSGFAQRSGGAEKYGNTLNLAVGIGYYGYINHSVPVLHLNYEFDVANNFTLAPFISFYQYDNTHYYRDPKKNYPSGYYGYRATVIPIGLKGTYYFDQILNASSKWDFYLAGSLGFAIVSTKWDDNYYGDRNDYNRANPLYLDLHIGAEYHISNKLGIFLDLSSGISTLGLSIH
jgi:hypothetical protein